MIVGSQVDLCERQAGPSRQDPRHEAPALRPTPPGIRQHMHVRTQATRARSENRRQRWRP